MNDIPFIQVTGIREIHKPKFCSSVSNSKIFKRLMLFLLFLEVIFTITMSNFKAEKHRTSNIFKEIHIFFTFAFFIEFVINFMASPSKYFKKPRNYADFIAVVLSFISIYYENYTNLHQVENMKSENLLFIRKQYHLLTKNESIQILKSAKNKENMTDRFYSWSSFMKQRQKMMKSPVLQLISFCSEKFSIFFSSICAPKNSPINILDVLKAIRLTRVFYLNKYLEAEFKSFIKVTSSSFPILLIFSVFTVFFGFIGNYLYEEGTPSLFGNMFISVFTVFGVSTKDMWVTNTKLINKGIQKMKYIEKLKVSDQIINQTVIPQNLNQKIHPTFVDKGVSMQNYFFKAETDEVDVVQKKFNEKDQINIEKSFKSNQASDQLDNNANDDQNHGQNNNIEKVDDKTVNGEIEDDDDLETETNSTEGDDSHYEGQNPLNELLHENRRRYRAKTIIHHSHEYKLAKKARKPSYSVWFTVSIVTVLGTILSTFIVSQVTDTFSSGTDNLERSEKRKSIHRVLKILRKYKSSLVLNAPIDPASSSSLLNTDPEVYLSDKQFDEMINILTYLKKSKEQLKEFIESNQILIYNKKESRYNYNYVYEYYDQDYFAFASSSSEEYKKEVLKRRRLIEELEIMLQYYLELSQNAFAEEVIRRHRKGLVHSRDITRKCAHKSKRRSQRDITSGSTFNIRKAAQNLNMMNKRTRSTNDMHNKSAFGNMMNINYDESNVNQNNASLYDIEKYKNDQQNKNLTTNNVDFKIDTETKDKENTENDNSNTRTQANPPINNNNSANTSKYDNENASINKNKNTSVNKNNITSVNDNENALMNDNAATPDYNIKNDDGSAIALNVDDSNSSFPVVSNINIDGSKPIIESSRSEIKEYSVEDYSDAYDDGQFIEDSETSESYRPTEFECFGAAEDVNASEVDQFPPPPSSKKTTVFNPQFIKSMKIILKHFINDMERCIELQSALIGRLSELSHE